MDFSYYYILFKFTSMLKGENEEPIESYLSKYDQYYTKYLKEENIERLIRKVHQLDYYETMYNDRDNKKWNRCSLVRGFIAIIIVVIPLLQS